MIMPQLIINTYGSLMYELKKIVKVFTSKFVGTGPSSYKKRIYRAAVLRSLRNTGRNYDIGSGDKYAIFVSKCVGTQNLPWISKT
jgi:uncharacterized protein YbcI